MNANRQDQNTSVEFGSSLSDKRGLAESDESKDFSSGMVTEFA